jgi:hypothetical protein
MRRIRLILSLALVAALLPAAAVCAQEEAGEVDSPPTLADAGKAELATLDQFIQSPSWTKRAIAAVRLQRYFCVDSRDRLVALLRDSSWQVRCFAIHSLARRRIPAEPDWFATEQEPRVLRTALRHRYEIDPERLDRGVRYLADTANLENWLLAAELAAAGGDEELKKVGREAAKRVILRMSRAEGGLFSPRLAVITGHEDLRRTHRWKRWMIGPGRIFELQPGYVIDEGDEPIEPSLIAQLDSDRFAALEDYMEQLSTREVDLAICLDCTASMSGELSAAQAGIDDLMLFVGDVVKAFRFALVAYRDRRDRDFETKGWDFTTSGAEARQWLWLLSAYGGGDRPEAVYPAMKLACMQLSWRPEHDKILIVIGDAPPHVGYGSHCVELARRGAEIEMTTHAIEAEGEEVEYFADIARAGEGRVVSLEDDDLLIPEIAGLTLGEIFEPEFREFFRTYLGLCR